MGLVTSVEQIEPRDQVGSSFASLPHKLGAAAALLFQTGAPGGDSPPARCRPTASSSAGRTHHQMELYCVPCGIPGFHECAGSRDGEGRRSSGSWRWADIRGVLCALKLLAARQQGA